MKDKSIGNYGKQAPQKFYDLTEKASRREDEEATKLARQLGNDGINEETNIGPAGKDLDALADNKVETSLDE
jgi:hypothetical protein